MAGWLQSCMNILRAQLLVSRVNQAVKLFPRVPMAPIVLGTLAACGGKFIVDAVNLAMGNQSGASYSAPFSLRRCSSGAAEVHEECKYPHVPPPLPPLLPTLCTASDREACQKQWCMSSLHCCHETLSTPEP